MTTNSSSMVPRCDLPKPKCGRTAPLHPERFSPNVILRGLFQETILPNLAFIGGGGETAYWLELKALFDHYQVPFPVLILRNSFLLIDRQGQEKIDRAGLSRTDLFRPAEDLVSEIVRRESGTSALAGARDQRSQSLL